MRKLYLSAWVLLTAAAFVSALTGAFTPIALLVFSLLALGLVYALLLWSVIVNTYEIKTE